VLDPDHRIAEYSAAVRAGNHIAQANAAVDDNNVKAV
jgi:hypothetical protein